MPASNLQAPCLLSAVCSVLFCLSSTICPLGSDCLRCPRPNTRTTVYQRLRPLLSVPRTAGSVSAISCDHLPPCKRASVPGPPNGRLTVLCSPLTRASARRMGQIPLDYQESAESECIAVVRDVRLSPSFHQRLFFFFAPRNVPQSLPHSRSIQSAHFNRNPASRPPGTARLNKIFNPAICICTATVLLSVRLSVRASTLWPPPAVSCSLSPIPTTSPYARVPRYPGHLLDADLTTRHILCSPAYLLP